MILKSYAYYNEDMRNCYNKSISTNNPLTVVVEFSPRWKASEGQISAWAKILGICLLFSLASAIARADTDENIIFHISGLPNMRLVGQGELTYLFWNVYEAQLFSLDGKYTLGNPLALKLSYQRDVSGQLIADLSTDEIKRQGFNDEARLAQWHEKMKNIFPDVRRGTTLLGVYRPDHKTCFYKDNEPIGCIEDQDFGPVFFDIWLSPSTSHPELRDELLGLAQ